MSVGLGSSLFALNFVSAQQVSDPASSQAPETAPADRVVITGSNIPTSEEVGASPVDTVDQATRDKTGQEDVLTVLTESNPAISSGGGQLGQSNAGTGVNSTFGGSAVALHGLPALVLLDGRRLTDSASAAAFGSTFTNVNLFPSALVKRIEVLKDGASAIYGTEAVGGVINVILDQDFTGFEISGRYGFTEKSDVNNQRYSAIFGFGDDKTHMVIGAEYAEQDPLFNRTRDYAKPFFGTNSFAGSVVFRTPTGNAAGTGPGTVYFTLNPGLNSPSDVYAPGSLAIPTTAGGPNPAPNAYFANGTTTANSSGPNSAEFDLSSHENITLDQNRLNVFASADRQLFGKYVVAFADFLYASNYSQSALNAQPLNTSAAYGVVIPATAPFNPFNGAITGANASQIRIANRFVDLPRVTRVDDNFYRVVAGLKGEIIPNYNYEVALNTSRDQITVNNPGLILLSELNQAIAGGYDAAGNAVARGPYSLVDGNLQPAVDFFARNQAAGALNGLSGDQLTDLQTKFYGLDGKITAFPVNLPAGPLGIAAGGEWRHETLRSTSSPAAFVLAVPVVPIQAARDVTAGFAEVSIPLVSPEMKIPGVYRADLTGAVRFEDYDPGQSTWVPKVGFDYSPIKDITLRGTFSKSFIAPNLYQTNGPVTSGATNAYNIGGGNEQANSEGGGNPNLANTRADTYTAGIVISPHQLEGLTLNLDFFHVEETRLTGSINPTQAIASVNAAGAASPFNQFVHVDAFNGPLASTALGIGNLPGQGNDLYVVANEANLGALRVGGLDFGVHYNHDFGKFGSTSIGVDGTYYLQYKFANVKGAKFFDIIGYYSGDNLGGVVEPFHLTPTVAYSFHGFTASAIANYIPALRDAEGLGGVAGLDPTPNFGGYNTDKNHELVKIRDYYDIDLLFSYEFGLNKPVDQAPVPPAPKDGKDGGKQVVSHDEVKKMMSFNFLDGLKLSFGITNVTNARPPRVTEEQSQTSAVLYDPYQRSYYFVITKKF